MEGADGGGLGFLLQWQVGVCALIFLVPGVVSVVLISRSKTAESDGSDLWIPCWRNLHPFWLLFYRVSAFVCMSWMLFRMVVAARGLFAFYFYTQWTFTLVIVYFALGTVISAHGCWNYSNNFVDNDERTRFLKSDSRSKSTPAASKATKSKVVKLQNRHDHEEVDRRLGFWGYMMPAIYQTCAGAVMLTDIVFWCLLVPFFTDDNFRVDLLMASMHILNAVFLLADTALNNMPFSWFGMTYFILWGCLYVIFQWVLHACGFTWWPYPFLELSTPWAPLWYFMMALVHIPCYGLYVLVINIKNSVFARLFPHAYVRSY